MIEHQAWDAGIVRQLDDLRIEFDAAQPEAMRASLGSCLLRSGFAVLDGLGGDRQAAASQLLTLGGLLGRVVAQSPRGELVEDVRDYSDSGERDDRGYRSGGEISPHSDPPTLIALHCLQAARSGGESHLVNVRAIHDCIAARDPDSLDLLYQGMPYWLPQGMYGVREAGPGEGLRPVFTRRDGRVSCMLYRPFIEMSAAARGQPLSARQLAALDHFDACSHDERLALRFILAPGQTLLLHNRSVLHARTDYEDWPEPERRRHLLRIWVDAPELLPADPQHEVGDAFGGVSKS